MFVTFEGGAHFTGNMKEPANTSSNRNGVETLAEFHYVVWQSHANIGCTVMQELLMQRLTPHVLVRRWETHIVHVKRHSDLF